MSSDCYKNFLRNFLPKISIIIEFEIGGAGGKPAPVVILLLEQAEMTELLQGYY